MKLKLEAKTDAANAARWPRKLGAVEGHIEGYYTELMRRHNWPPGFKSAPIEVAGNVAHLRDAAIANRAKFAEQGIGWGSGTMVMPQTPKHRAPGWM